MDLITLKDFLIKYTAVPINFIEKYYKFYELCDKNYFGISIDSIIKFLEIKKSDNFISNLKRRFALNQDYIIIKKDNIKK